MLPRRKFKFAQIEESFCQEFIPEKQLMAAILNRTIKDILIPKFKHFKPQALEFLASNERGIVNEKMTFHFICEHLDISCEMVRQFVRLKKYTLED